nr:reverse transcriptase domain-containing protein [Tanacetum cinerariifolium]
MKPTNDPGEANTAPRVNIQELCEEYYEDILPIIMEKARHERLKDVHAILERVLRKEQGKIPTIRTQGPKIQNPNGQSKAERFYRLSEASSPNTIRSRPRKINPKDPLWGRSHARTLGHESDIPVILYATKKYAKDPVEIHNIKQRDGETLEDFMERFKIEIGRMKGAPECIQIFGFMHGINNPELTKRLNEHVPRTMEEMMIATTAFIRRKAAAANKKKGHMTPKEVLAAEANKFQPPPPMVTLVEKRNGNKFCDFHNDKWHSTDECMQLKKQIEELVRAGKLSHLIKEIKQGREGKKQQLKTSPQRSIWFDHEGPLVTEAEVGGHTIHRMYIDSGSSMEILYEHCFNRLRPDIKRQMVPATTSLTGFSGDTTWPLGQLKLLAVPSTVHAMLKFSTEEGIVTIRSSLLIPAECASVDTSSVTPGEKKAYPANLTVPLHPNFPYQEVVVGGSLSDEGRTELCSLLKMNLDIFAWQPYDITGVPRSVVEHRLNDCYPLPEIDWKVESLNGYPFKCFLDAYKGYHQIQMAAADEKNSFPHRTGEAEQAFQQLKQHLSALPLLAASKPREELIMYLSATHEAISAVLMTERGTAQTPVYFISRALQGPKLNYSPMEKLVLSLVFASKRLQIYFQAHPIAVITDQPIKQVMSRLDAAGRLQKWSIMLGEHNIAYRPRTLSKGKILADFLNEMPSNASQGTPVAETQEEPWTLFTDGSLCVDGSGAGLILTNPDGIEFTYALRFQFAASNNEVEYEALIAGTPPHNKTSPTAFDPNHGSVAVLQVGNRHSRPLFGRARESKVPDSRNGLLHEVDRSKSSGNDYWQTSDEIRMGQYCSRFGIPGEIISDNVIPAEIGMPTYRTAVVDVVNNDEELRLNLDLLGERQELAAMSEARSKSKMIKYYNSRVHGVAFKPGDFVYRSNDASHAVAGGKLGPKWEGPYEVTDALGNGAYKLRSMDEMMLPKTWNVTNLKRCYL